MTKTRQDNDVTDCIGLVYCETETKLWDLFDRVQSMMKTRQDNDLTNCISMVYVEKETKLSWWILLGAVHDEN